MRSIVLVAPRAWGKTHNREKLKQHFGCQQVVDNWFPGERVAPGSLVLTDRIPRNNHLPAGARVVTGVSAEDALRAVGGVPFGGRK